MEEKTAATKQESIHIDGYNFHFVPAPHLIDRDDWHTAYKKRIIRKFLILDKNKSTPLPDYPALYDISNERGFDFLDFIFECGAYWEGAIYYLHTILDQKDLLEGVDKVINSEVENLPDIKWKLFSHIWNQYDQLGWLKAHIVRRYCCQDLPEELLDGYAVIERVLLNAEDSEPVKWLTNFVYEHPRDKHNYPNPYYGGGNPLHLGLGLDY